MTPYILKRFGPIYGYQKYEQVFDTGEFIVQHSDEYPRFRFIVSMIVYVNSVLATCYMQWPAFVAGFVLERYLSDIRFTEADKQNWTLIIRVGLLTGLMIRISHCVYKIIFLYNPLEIAIIGTISLYTAYRMFFFYINQSARVRDRRIQVYVKSRKVNDELDESFFNAAYFRRLQKKAVGTILRQRLMYKITSGKYHVSLKKTFPTLTYKPTV